MKLFLSLLLALSAYSQDTAAFEAAQAHQKAVQLVEMSGGRTRLAAAIPALVQQGTAVMMKQCPDCSPIFFTEWSKRMTARLNVDDLLNVAVRAYEKNFTSGELAEFLTVASSQKSDKPLPLSSALQKKMVAVMPAMMGEINGGTTEIGAKLGRDVGSEIEKEHPEYMAKPKPAVQ